MIKYMKPKYNGLIISCLENNIMKDQPLTLDL